MTHQTHYPKGEGSFYQNTRKMQKRLIIIGANKPEAIYISQSKKFKLNT